VAELILTFFNHVEQHYRRPDGTQTSEVAEFRRTLRLVRIHYGLSMAKDFGPLALQAIRQKMIDGWVDPDDGPQAGLARWRDQPTGRPDPSHVQMGCGSAARLPIGLARTPGRCRPRAWLIGGQRDGADSTCFRNRRKRHPALSASAGRRDGQAAAPDRHAAGRSGHHARPRPRHQRQGVALSARKRPGRARPAQDVLARTPAGHRHRAPRPGSAPPLVAFAARGVPIPATGSRGGA
jgi:hypothetical protein